MMAQVQMNPGSARAWPRRHSRISNKFRSSISGPARFELQSPRASITEDDTMSLHQAFPPGLGRYETRSQLSSFGPDTLTQQSSFDRPATSSISSFRPTRSDTATTSNGIRHFDDWSFQSSISAAPPSSIQHTTVPVDVILSSSPVIDMVHDVANNVKRSASIDGACTNLYSSPPSSITISEDRIEFGQVDFNGGKQKGKKRDPSYIPPSKRPGVSHARKTAPDHIKRPRNAFIIFRSHTVAEGLIPQDLEKDHRNISRIVSLMWKSLNPEERLVWESAAAKEKEEHRFKYPDYKYKPTGKRENVTKRNVKRLENAEEQSRMIANYVLQSQGKWGVAPEALQSQLPVKKEKLQRPKKTKSSLGKKAGGSSSSGQHRALQQKARRDAQRSKSGSVSLETLPAVLLHLHNAPVHQTPDSASSAISQFASSSTSFSESGPGTPASALYHSPVEKGFSLNSCRASSPPPLPPVHEPEEFSQQDIDAAAQGVTCFSTEKDTTALGGFFSSWDDRLREAGSDKILGSDDGDSHGQVGQELQPRLVESIQRKTRPPPFLSAWYAGSLDDQVLPSPTANAFFHEQEACNKMASSSQRPQTAQPSTPASSSFRTGFQPWSYCSDAMLVSPMRGTFSDMRRTSMALLSQYSRQSVSMGTSGLRPRGDSLSRGLAHLPSASLSSYLFEDATRAAESSMQAASLVDMDAALHGSHHHLDFSEVQGADQVKRASEEPEEHIFQFEVASAQEAPNTRWAEASTLAPAAREWMTSTQVLNQASFSSSTLNDAFSAAKDAASQEQHEQAQDQRDSMPPLRSMRRSVVSQLRANLSHGSPKAARASSQSQQDRQRLYTSVRETEQDQVMEDASHHHLSMSYDSHLETLTSHYMESQYCSQLAETESHSYDVITPLEVGILDKTLLELGQPGDYQQHDGMALDTSRDGQLTTPLQMALSGQHRYLSQAFFKPHSL